ncbi:unnamed protein product [Mytilus coruscus]|uniref:Uncharacterized protein n=1 Tax=Mytilus coruscus TaxID=42192 RepID=A0A6J8AA51_MYTCO|nr:unnamed protein product [Mytilus coruscus]
MTATKFRKLLAEKFKEIARTKTIFSGKDDDPIQNDIGFYYKVDNSTKKGLLLPLPDHVKTPKDLKSFFGPLPKIEILIRRKLADVSMDPDSKRKVLAESLFDASLFAANANQLRKVYSESKLLSGLLGTTLIVQFVIAILLMIIIGWRNPPETPVHRIHVVVIFLTAFTLILNIFIAAFDIANE